MKKGAVILVFVLLVSMGLNACRASKPPCPAYRSAITALVSTIQASL